MDYPFELYTIFRIFIHHPSDWKTGTERMRGMIKKKQVIKPDSIYPTQYSPVKYRLIIILIMLLLLFYTTWVYGEQTENRQEKTYQIQTSEKEVAHDSGKEKQEPLNIFSLTLEEVMNISVEVSSKFPEKDLVAGSSVSKISSEKWKIMGARRMHDVLNNEMSVMTYPHYNAYPIAIRGFKFY